MSAFEFFFSFFGLILGLSVAEVMTGFARVLKRRNRIRMGYVTPLLAVLLLLDLASFWSNTWGMMQSIQISLHLLIIGVIVAGTYFLAASLVFPDDLDEWPSLDAFYDTHKRWVVGGVWLANMVSGIGFTAFVTTPDEFWPNMVSADSLITVATFSAIMGGIALLRDHRLNAAILVAGMATYLF
ncbi:MAG: hypothetical protein EON89_14355 [Brevundimonas sp.]|nr:MAG: hypothetical protein EON89_14355 [Brevundimonas sp.]